MVSRETETIVQEIADSLADSADATIIPGTFYRNHPRGSVAAAFRVAKERGIIERVPESVRVYRRGQDWDLGGVLIWAGETVAVPKF
jgi:hypothetical protein